MKMTFDDLKKQITNYIVKPHHHSTWNLQYLHFMTKRDGSSHHYKHYYVSYGDKKRRFKIAICNNNIKFQNVSNIPGSFHGHKGRILGACLDFVRHNGSHAYNSHNYSKDCKANKWSDYDNKMFDKNDTSSQPTVTNDSNIGKKLVKQSRVILQKGNKNAFKQSCKDVVNYVNSLDISDVFKHLVTDMRTCGFILISFGRHKGLMPVVADFVNSKDTCLSFNYNQKRVSVNNPNGINVAGLAKPKLYLEGYYKAIKNAAKNRKEYSFKL